MMARSECASITALRRCRESVLLMRQQEATLIQLVNINAQSSAERDVLAGQIEGLRGMLDGTRNWYRDNVVKAVCELSGLSGRDYDVLCMYYVIGLSIAEISRKLQCNIRTVTRRKARALALLVNEIPTIEE